MSLPQAKLTVTVSRKWTARLLANIKT